MKTDRRTSLLGHVQRFSKGAECIVTERAVNARGTQRVYACALRLPRTSETYCISLPMSPQLKVNSKLRGSSQSGLKTALSVGTVKGRGCARGSQETERTRSTPRTPRRRQPVVVRAISDGRIPRAVFSRPKLNDFFPGITRNA